MAGRVRVPERQSPSVGRSEGSSVTSAVAEWPCHRLAPELVHVALSLDVLGRPPVSVRSL